MSMSLKQFYHC